MPVGCRMRRLRRALRQIGGSVRKVRPFRRAAAGPMTQLPRRPRSPAAPTRSASLPGARPRWPSWPHASRSAARARAWSAWREQTAAVKRRSFQAEPYWGRPVPGWGDERPRVLIVGLAPAAHGGNRTGRIFTGDRSGDWLFGSLHRCGLAAQPQSVAAGDGQRLLGARMVAAVRCAPPANRPSPQERDTCAPWLVAELAQLADCVRVIVALGGFAWQASWPALRAAGFTLPRPHPPFRARSRGPAHGRCGGTAGASHRLLPPQPAEHVHRPRDPRHARRCLPAGHGGRIHRTEILRTDRAARPRGRRRDPGPGHADRQCAPASRRPPSPALPTVIRSRWIIFHDPGDFASKADCPSGGRSERAEQRSHACARLDPVASTGAVMGQDRLPRSSSRPACARSLHEALRTQTREYRPQATEGPA